MSRNPILICAPSPALRNQLEAELAEIDYAVVAVSTAAEAITHLRDGEIHLVVAEGLAVSGAMARLRSAAPVQVPILVIAPAGDVEARIAFLEAGADDVIAAGFDRGELEARIEALLIRAGRMTAATLSDQPAGQVVTFFSPKGGVGTTTLAVNTAVLLAAGQGAIGGRAAQVLLVDLDLQFGQVATHLNLTPHFDVASLCADAVALADVDQALSYLTHHSSGVQVLAAPANPEADFAVTVDQLERAIGILRPRFDHVIVDCGSRLDPRTLWMLEQADIHIFVIFPEIAALRATSLMLAFLADTATLRARTSFVVNHLFPRELLKTRDIENLLRATPIAEIPYTDVDMIRAVNEGVPLVASRPSSPASLAIGKIASAIVGIDTVTSQIAPGKERRVSLFARR